MYDRVNKYFNPMTVALADPRRRKFPDLRTKPWYSSEEVNACAYLEKNHETIKHEFLSLDGGAFVVEAEDLERSGDWSVFFFSERGRSTTRSNTRFGIEPVNRGSCWS